VDTVAAEVGHIAVEVAHTVAEEGRSQHDLQAGIADQLKERARTAAEAADNY